MNQFNPITEEYKPVRYSYSEADPEKVHAELLRDYGSYPQYRELMDRYYACTRKMDVSGAIIVLIEFDEKMRKNKQTQFLPLISTLNARLTDFALEIARSGGGAR